MTPSDLAALAGTAYGKHWPAPLARDLGVAYGTVWAWRHGRKRITPAAALRVMVACRARRAARSATPERPLELGVRAAGTGTLPIRPRS
mgnify:CR=1 FL=1